MIPRGASEGREARQPNVAEPGSLAAIHKRLLKQLEAQIDLPAWLVARGFQIAPLQPEPAQLAMTGPALEVFYLRKDVDRGGWAYANASNPADRGSVVDFMVSRDATTLESCVSRLAGCVVRAHLSPEGLGYQEALRDRGDTLHRAEAIHLAAVRAEREATRDLERLGIDRTSFDESRFGRLRNDADVAALLRNPTTLEHSRYRLGDRAIVFVERPIDAIAYDQARGKGRACYVYIGDNPGPESKQKIAHLLADLPDGMKVVLALGRDRQANELASDLAKLAPSLNSERHAPQFGGRWSDQVQMEQCHRKHLQRGRGIER